MTKPIPESLAEMKKVNEARASMRSDDFGHNTHELLLAESDALQKCADDLAKLIEVVELAINELDEIIEPDAEIFKKIAQILEKKV